MYCPKCGHGDLSEDNPWVGGRKRDDLAFLLCNMCGFRWGVERSNPQQPTEKWSGDPQRW